MMLLMGVGGSYAAPANTNDPNFANVVLLAGFDGADAATSATDESSVGRALTFVGNAQLDTAEKKYGTAALLLDGTGDEVTAADSADWQFSGQFTVEAWIFRTANDNQPQGVIGQYGAIAARNWRFRVTRASSSGSVSFDLSTDGNSPTHSVTDTTNVALNTWHHIAVDRDGANKLRLYVNGTMTASKTGASGTSFNSAANLQIGGALNAGNAWLGSLDEIRITKGVARYASDSGFTVPAAAYPRS